MDTSVVGGANAGASKIHWSADGRFLLYAATSDQKKGNDLFVLPLSSDGQAGKPRAVFERPFTFDRNGYAVARDGRFLISAPARDDTAPIHVMLNWHLALKQ